MATIVRATPANPACGTDRWAQIASVVSGWAQSEGVELRDAVMLLPFAQLLPSARNAFARVGGWAPRIETSRTLAVGCGPAAAAQAGQISFDASVDVLSAAALLRSQAWGAAWARRDARGFDQAAVALSTTAQALARAAFALPAAERPAHWGRAREALTPVSGPGGIERLLARIALEWAAVAPAPATDRLFTMTPPSAWIVVQAGGPDAFAERLMAVSTARCLVVDTDAPEVEPFGGFDPARPPALVICDGFEHEAQCAAAQVLAHVMRSEVPVALIAQDRVLVRRVRALIERQNIAVVDETGWKLSTTRAAAQVMALLRAARVDASADALFDWLKTGAVWTSLDGGAALSDLETACRRAHTARMAALERIPLGAEAARLRAASVAVLAALASPDAKPLASWLTALGEALSGCGAMELLQADEAGRQVLVALRLARGASASSAWTLGASQTVMGFDTFGDWVDAALEQATFLPPSPVDVPAQVVITPLARAMLRPFGAVVCPGADDRRLGAMPMPDALLGDTLAGTLGMPSVAQRRDAELRAFTQLRDAPHLTFMRRRVEGTDPLADSPLIERLSLALSCRGRTLAAWHDPRVEIALTPTPIRRSAPSAVALLPDRLSASACEALRACPYRFFALNMLRLREDDELEREVEKRDYGTWLHGVLFDFHASRGAPAPREAEIAHLMALAEVRSASQGILDADFLPFAASFAVFAPRYVEWLHRRDAEGAHWRFGETELSTAPAEFDGASMRGVIDRVDDILVGAAAALQLIDYKTGGAQGLRDIVREPLEDTQLAFYAALMRVHTDLPITASYLAIDGTKGIEEIAHPDVADSATALVAGLAHDLRRLREGSGMAALGEGATCDFCVARGVCRRDHWSDEPQGAP